MLNDSNDPRGAWSGSAGKKIFIIHGWTYTTGKWDELVNLLTQAGFEPVLLNVPGLTEESDRVWTLDNYVEWLSEKLSGEEKPVVVGHSNGGRIALAFAAQFPEKLSHLILVDSAGVYHNELPLRIKRAVFGAAARFGKKLTSSETLRKALYKLAGEKDYKNANENMRKTMAGLIAIDLVPKLSSITVPTLIIWGEQDTATPLSDAYVMQKLIPHADLFTIPSAGHSPHFSHARVVSERIVSVLK